GEIIVNDANGRSSFQALQNVLSDASGAKPLYYAFDLPYLDGHDLCEAPLVDRKALLRELIGTEPLVRYSDHVEGNGRAFFDEACRLGLEGIVSKRADSAYQAVRGRNWQKVKCALRQEFVIGGYTDPQGARSGFGALLLGVYDGKDLRYCGKVGTGFNEALLASLAQALQKRAVDKSPFINPPTGAEGRRAHWVKPDLVCEVSFTEWTRDGTLRHPSFQGVREDKRARDVVREEPAHAAPDAASADGPPPTPASPRPKKQATTSSRDPASKRTGTAQRSSTAKSPDTIAGVAISNGDKVLYPEAKVTKRELARYYETIGDWIVPHLENRPLTLVRCPNGWNKPCFFQKHASESVSEFIERVDIREGGGEQPYMMANTVSAVVALVQMGVLEIHPWGSRAPRLAYPDRLIFDFDPDESLGWEKVVEAVDILRKLLETLGLRPFIKTTGGKGLHVVIPIRPTRAWDQAKAFCKAIAELLVRTFPDRFTSKITKSTREGRIFVDYLRNAENATAIAAYSVRAKSNAPVAMPIAWEQLKDDLRFDHFNVRNVPGLLRRRRHDPWSDLDVVEQELTDAMLRQVGVS
ncbi:MAG TPA: DNA ligase D, partial [Casimicrobiaceae bacterium]|nr:DNA ligase D [Casimicrobiaceae bacterium]